MSGIKLLLVTGTALVVGVAPVSAATLLSDTFNSENSGSPALNFTGFSNWNVIDGSVDLIGNGLFDFFPGNGLYVDMDGSSGNAGSLESKLAFVFAPGEVVDLSFDILGIPTAPVFASDNEMSVSLGGLFNEVFDVSETGTVFRSFAVSSPTIGVLAFDHAGGDNGGLILDNVMLSTSSTPPPVVPEPVTTLGGLCALGFGMAMKRKHAAGKK